MYINVQGPGPILVDFQTGNLFEGGAVDLGHKPSWLDLSIITLTLHKNWKVPVTLSLL